MRDRGFVEQLYVNLLCGVNDRAKFWPNWFFRFEIFGLRFQNPDGARFSKNWCPNREKLSYQNSDFFLLNNYSWNFASLGEAQILNQMDCNFIAMKVISNGVKEKFLQKNFWVQSKTRIWGLEFDFDVLWARFFTMRCRNRPNRCEILFQSPKSFFILFLILARCTLAAKMESEYHDNREMVDQKMILN